MRAAEIRNKAISDTDKSSKNAVTHTPGNARTESLSDCINVCTLQIAQEKKYASIKAAAASPRYRKKLCI